ncbi:RNA dependent RNA polymerase-domain-containing protein [Syncephalastrum racemosum]|uniref:RNA-dependent RNA polymerase n=1 Tax=Syncephalastrum racemosum TaxID=13706 RepID=A0A1X2HRL9_SYNRA|nr:RNA dependent RNA polymerase-domain-containing protein [Syncephalastrum racemosum]
MTELDKDVVKYCKQIYNHLGLRDRIQILNRPHKAWPLEVQRMQTLCLGDRARLNKTVRGFLEWKPPSGKKKTLDDVTEYLTTALSACKATDTLTDTMTFDTLTIPSKKRPASDMDGPDAKRMRSDSVSSTVSTSTSITTTTTTNTTVRHSSSSPSPLTPPLSPFDITDEAHNVLCTLPRQFSKLDSISWTAQFELARFIQTCRVHWQDLTFDTLQRFHHVANEQPRTLHSTFLQWYGTHNKNATLGVLERCSDHVWQHTEKPPASVPNRAIHYSAIMALSLGKTPTIQLRPAKVGASNRFFRKFGDSRFLELKVTKSSHPGMIRQNKDFFLKPFLLMGRVFKFLFVKDSTIILFATEGAGLEPICIRSVIDWHIPIIENWSMTICKFASRMSLGYSNSIATLTFQPHEIQYIDDIYSGAPGGEETCMTDGCGLISIAAMRKIMGAQHENELPCAVQGRIGGAKGIWLVAPELDLNAGDFIQIRKSQHKFKTGLPQLDMSTDPLHYTFDLVKNAICIYPSNLNTQFIQCMASGGVPTSAFLEILDEYLQRLAMVVTENRNILILRDWVARTGSIMRARWETEDTEKDIWREQPVDDDYVECLSTEEDMGASLQRQSTDYGKVNPYSGQPVGLHESTVRLMDAGFDLSNPYLAQKITNVFRDVMRSVVTKYKIEVTESCTVTCVPDPTGTLQEGEIFLQLSKRRTDEQTGLRAGLIMGDLLVTRNPCGLKSDVQKVKAVDCAGLRSYSDVLICSVKGRRSLASMLGGGDYDGDIVFCCWDQRLVQPFQGSPVPPTPKKADDAFEESKTRVRDELARMRDKQAMEAALQRSFISVLLPDSTLGVYENWRTVLSEHTSLDHPDVVYLSHMCAKLVDAPKQGLALKETALRRDRAAFAKLAQPAWFLDKKNRQRSKEASAYREVNQGVVPDLPDKCTTAMDHLYHALLKQTERFTRYTRCMFDDQDIKFKDDHLAGPYETMLTHAQQHDPALLKDLETLAHEIDTHLQAHQRNISELMRVKQSKMDSRHNPTRETEPFLLDYTQFRNAFEVEENAAREYQAIPTTPLRSSVFLADQAGNQGRMLETVKASYAYRRTIHNEKYSKYCYVVAFDALRRLKADARAKEAKVNLAHTTVPYMYTAMNIDKAWVRKIKESKRPTDYGTEQVRIDTQPAKR